MFEPLIGRADNFLYARFADGSDTGSQWGLGPNQTLNTCVLGASRVAGAWLTELTPAGSRVFEVDPSGGLNLSQELADLRVSGIEEDSENEL